MTLWNIIRDFYVQYIFGGVDSNDQLYNNNFVGRINIYNGDNEFDEVYQAGNNEVWLKAGMDTPDGYKYFLGMGDWLSTTFTIITLIVFVVLLYCFLKWLFKVVSGLILLKR